MSEDRRKQNRPSTGTVPKVKCRNNTSLMNERDSPRSWTNNLAGDFHRLNLSDYLRNSRRNLPPHCAMNGVEDQRHLVNGSITPNTSSSTSRRNSSGMVPKCDNITKYPDKKQIEDKLSQIREYLQITTSLMCSMKNTDDQYEDAIERNNLAQMIKDLKDSELKLVSILDNIDKDFGDKIEQTDRNDNYSEPSTSNLDDQQMSLLSLQQKAENKMRDARQIQDKLMRAQYDINNSVHQRDKNLPNVQDFDAAITELEERTRRLNEPRSGVSVQDRLLADVDSLHSQIVTLHSINEDRNQMLQVLDNRDGELRLQHQELQARLGELQNRKQQVDHMVAQLQNVDEGEEEEDVGAQVRRIVTMKEQLAKLKDMLEIVKTTEGVMQNSNGTQEEQELACEICTKAENLLQKDTRRKQNKNASYDRQGARPKRNSNKLALQVELEAKKKELEEIMGKHKAGTSNLNHDVGTDNKSEFSCASNAYYDEAPRWPPVMSDHNRFDSSESEDNEYTELNHNQQFVPVLNLPQNKPEHHNDHVQVQEGGERFTGARRTSTRTPLNGKTQVQKQLELIRSVCDSMLENQGPNNVRNNLTPSSLYSEPRSVNALVETPWALDPAAYQGWLATNTLQTQAFMLNTLNQCCQMLWLQQRELMALRQTVTQLQERDSQFENTATPMQAAPSNRKVNVATACSMPNLNQYVPNPDPTYQNNMLGVNNAEHINNGVLHVNANMWNGQALNNQVAPGNRANNYWDNFRSYSRQNLLSTKSNEGFQSTSERSNNPFAFISLSKTNSDHNSSQENTPRRRLRRESRNNAGVPPDVLNVNHNVSKTENDYAFAYNEISSTTSNISEEQVFSKEGASENASRRNEWHEEQAEENHTKSKLFDELRDHVYKEVVTLISANETRPHFLIQLFRDLQMISSDPLRLKILQSIQTIITHSLVNHPNRQVPEPQQPEQVPEGPFSLQSTVWSKSLKNPALSTRNLQLENENDTEGVIKEIIPFLNDREDDLITHSFLVTLKQILLESEAFRGTVRDSVFKKHFSNVLDEVLTQFEGKKVRDVKMHLIQTVNDLLRGELSFIQLIQDTCPESCDSNEMYNSAPTVQVDGVVQNGDLAEADQGRVEADEAEEEGAVGGFWDLQVEIKEEDVSGEFQDSESQTQFMKQGLDQVPTRLPTKSRSNTPSRDRSTSSRSDHPDQF